MSNNPSNFLRVHRGDESSDSTLANSKLASRVAHPSRATSTSGLVSARDVHRLASQANDLADQMQAQHAIVRRQQVDLAVRSMLLAGETRRPTSEDHIDRLLGDATMATGTAAAAVYLLDDDTEFLATRFVFGLSPLDRLGVTRPLRGSRADLEAMVKGLVSIDDMNVGPLGSWKSPEPFPAGICVCLGETDMPLGTMWLYAAAAMEFNAGHTAAARLAASNLQQTLIRLSEETAPANSSIQLILPNNLEMPATVAEDQPTLAVAEVADPLDALDDSELLDAALENAIEEELAKSEELIAELQREFDIEDELDAEWNSDNELEVSEDSQWPLLSDYDAETMRMAAQLDVEDAQFLAEDYDPSMIDPSDADAMEFHHGWDNEPTAEDIRDSRTIDAIDGIIALIDDFDADFPVRSPERDDDESSLLNRSQEVDLDEVVDSEMPDLAEQVSIWQHQTLPMGTEIAPSWSVDGLIESPLDVAQSWHHWDVLPDGQIAIALCQPRGGASPHIDLSNVMDVTVVRAALQAHIGYRHQPADAVRRAFDTLFQIRDHSFEGDGHGSVSLLYAHIDPETGETKMASTGDWSTLAVSKFGYRPVGSLDRESVSNHQDPGDVGVVNSRLHLQQGEVLLIAGCDWMGLQPASSVPGYPQHQIGTAITQAMRVGKRSPLAALRSWLSETTLSGERTAMTVARA